MVLRTICGKVTSFLLIVILLSGNLLSCTRKSDANVNDTFAPLQEDVYTVFLEDTFHAETDDIVISYATLDEHNELSSLIAPGRQLNVKKVVTNLAIGGAIVLVTVVIAVNIGTVGPVVATLWMVTEGAVVGTVISGVISYINNDGDLTEVFYDAVEGGSEGFKYGAIFAVSRAAFSAIRLARQASKIMALVKALPVFGKTARPAFKLSSETIIKMIRLPFIQRIIKNVWASVALPSYVVPAAAGVAAAASVLAESGENEYII